MHKFWTASLESSAQQTVVAEKRTNTDLRKVGGGSRPCPEEARSSKRFLVSNMDHKRIGVLELRMPVAEHVVITFDAHIAPIYISLLLGLDVLRKLYLLINFDDGTIASTRDDWRKQLV